jgi:alpha-tubulin suppressor-like RCC1 family protein
MKAMIEKFQSTLALTILLAIAWPICESALAGTVTAWGFNQDGQCNAPPGQDFVAIAARFKHSLALKADGSIVCWGQNNWGQSRGNSLPTISHRGQKE